VPLFEKQGLGVALFSYDGQLTWGFNADWDVLPDLHDLVIAVSAEESGLQATLLGEERENGTVGGTRERGAAAG
jgi:hypothetical protein